MTWQSEAVAGLAARLPHGTTIHPYGSAADGTADAWSDLDVDLWLTAPAALATLLDGRPWAWSAADDTDGSQVVRVVARDGRRLDARVAGALIGVPPLEPDTAVRFDLALAAARFGRGDELIGRHLVTGVLRDALVTLMVARDARVGTSVHRRGSDEDALARDIAAVAGADGDTSVRPHVTEMAAAAWSRARRALDPTWLPDWTGLGAVLERGSAGA